MSDNNGIYTEIGFRVDQPSVNAAKAAVASVKDTVNKASAEASKAAIGVNSLQVELDKLSRADHLRSIGSEMGALAKKTNDTGAAVAELTRKLKELGASDDEIRSAAGAFEQSRNASDPSSGRNRLARFGSELRNLPSTQIPGLGIGSDAIGNFARLGGALQEMAKSALAARAATTAANTAQAAAAAASGANAATSTAAATAETAQAAANTAVAGSSVAAAGGTLAFVAAMGPIAVIGAAVAAVFILIVKGLQALSAASNEANAALTRAYEVNRSVQEAVLNGATSDEAIEQVRKATERVKNETDNLNAAKEANDKLFADLQAKYGDFFARLANLFGLGGFAANNKEIETATENLKKNKSEAEGWNKALEENKFAANDAKKAAEEKAKADEKSAEESARATEKAASDKQRADEKTAQVAEQAAKKVEQAQEAIAKATENYTNKQIDIARQSAEKLSDIQTSAQDKSYDTDLKFARDLVSLTEKTNFDRINAQRKAAEAEYQAVIDTNRKLEDLRDDATRSEQDAINERNFLQQAKIRENLDWANKAALKDAERATEDRKRAEEAGERDRIAQLEQARYERLRAYRQEQVDNQTNLNRQIRDARTAKDRQLNEAQISYNRELQAQAAFLNQMGVANAAYYQQQVNMASQAAGVASGASGGSSVPLGGGAGSFTPGNFGGLVPITPAPALRNGSTNYVTINANTSADVYDAVNRLGLIS